MTADPIPADPRDAVAEAFERVHALDDDAVFITLTDRHAALASVDPDAPLAGWTFAVKDNIDVAGLPTTAGCPSFAYRPSQDATAVARLRAAGATCVGKSNLDQFATGLVGTRSPFGTPVNPIDPRLAPGGSSSGSAVVVARGIVSVALGTDTAGSGRVPAAQCRIVGVKPTPGRVPNTGVVPAVRTVDCVSVFGRSVGTTVRARQVIEGLDDVDPFSRTVEAWPRRIRRLGVPDDVDLDSDRDQEAWAATIKAAAAVAVDLVPVSIEPLVEAGRLLYGGAWVAERWAAVGDHLCSHAADIDPVVRSVIEPAARFTAVQAFTDQHELTAIRRDAGLAWSGVDALLVPTTPGVATLEEVALDPVARNTRLGLYTNGVNLLGWCGVAIPGADRSDGWPFGVTVLGPPWSDDAVAEVAAALAGEPPPPAVPPDGLDVVVVGAHLSGMPLNRELTDRGAVLTAVTTTAPVYRLWAMAGGPVPKPALEHVGPGGSAVEVEVWRLPWAAVGPFLAGIPAPLGLGSIDLADGTTRTGFVAEPRALADATDVTTYGGWRAYVTSTA